MTDDEIIDRLHVAVDGFRIALEHPVAAELPDGSREYYPTMRVTIQRPNEPDVILVVGIEEPEREAALA